MCGTTPLILLLVVGNALLISNSDIGSSDGQAFLLLIYPLWYDICMGRYAWHNHLNTVYWAEFQLIECKYEKPPFWTIKFMFLKEQRQK
jgi:hypothetical protein